MRAASTRTPLGTGRSRLVWVAATALFILYIPTRTEVGTIGDMTLAFEMATAAMALNLVMGYGGIVSLGFSAYFGLGGYTMAVLVDHYGWSQGWTLYIAAVFGFVVGCLTSLPALRLKGVYLALTSIGLAVLFPQLVKWQKLEWLTGGARGIDDLQYDDIPEWPILGELDGRRGRAVFMFWLAVIVMALSYLVCRGIVKSRVGRSLIAIRDNETAAAVMGVNLARTKTLVYGLSAAMTATAGALFGIGLNGVNPDSVRLFTLVGSITFVVVMVIGGGATLWGPLIGAVALRHRRQPHPRVGRRQRRRRRRAVRLAEQLAGDVHPRRPAARADVRRPVRHRRPAQTPCRQGRRDRSEPGGHP